MVTRVALSMTLFWGSLAAGAFARRRGWLQAEGSRRMIQWMITLLEPVIIALSFWRLDLSSWRILWLPAVGCAIAAAALPPAWLAGRWLRLSRREMGSWLPCAFFSNLGYLGAFVAFALYGESAFSLAQLYMLFFTPCFYTLGFWLAAHYGGRSSAGHAASLSNPEDLRWYPLTGMLIGVALNLLRVPRPAWCGPLNSALIPSATAMYLVAVGSRLRVTRVAAHWRPCLAMSAIKFAWLPAVGWLLARAAGLTDLPLRVTLLEAAMPVATMPLMLPLLFDVDGELANHVWIVTTVLAAPLLPLLVWALGRL